MRTHNNKIRYFFSPKKIYSEKKQKIKESVKNNKLACSNSEKYAEKPVSDAFCKVPRDLYNNPKLSSKDVRNYSIFNSYATTHGVCWISNESLIEEFPFFSPWSIKRGLSKLEKLRLIFRIQQPLLRGGSRRLVITRCSHRKFCDDLIKKGNHEMANIIYEHFNNEGVGGDCSHISRCKLDDSQSCEQSAIKKRTAYEQKDEKSTEKVPFAPSRGGTNTAPSYIYNNTIIYSIKENVTSARVRDDSLKKNLSRGLSAEQVKEALELLKTMTQKQLEKIKNLAAYLTAIIKKKSYQLSTQCNENIIKPCNINELLKRFGDYFERKSVPNKPSFVNISSLSKGLEITTQGADASLCYHFFEYDLEPNGFFTKLAPICKKYGLSELLPPKWKHAC